MGGARRWLLTDGHGEEEPPLTRGLAQDQNTGSVITAQSVLSRAWALLGGGACLSLFCLSDSKCLAL